MFPSFSTNFTALVAPASCPESYLPTSTSSTALVLFIHYQLHVSLWPDFINLESPPAISSVLSSFAYSKQTTFLRINNIKIKTKGATFSFTNPPTHTVGMKAHEGDSLLSLLFVNSFMHLNSYFMIIL